MSFVHLHTHSHYSLLTALPKIEDLLEEAKAMGMTALAITDTSAMYGAVEFYTKAKEYDIKAILGAEIFICKDHLSKNNTAEDRRRHQLVLLVEDEVGYKNLMKLISIAQLDGFYYKARADKKLLREYGKGLIALSGSLQGEIPSELLYGNYDRAKIIALEYEEIFGKGNFFLELGPHLDNENQMTVNQGLIQISQETGIPVVAACDVHYVKREHAEIQDILLCIRDNKKVADHERFSMRSLDLSFRSPEEMTNLFAAIPEAVSNTQAIADRVHFKLHTGENQLPSFPLPEGKTADGYLRELCEEGLLKRYPDQSVLTEEHMTRLNYELKIIEGTGFASYFLIVQDFVNWAKNNGVVTGPGRGSAAGSFVAYLTGITDLDPIKYDLLFERFLNPERISMPDVDMDFADNRRDDVLNYVRSKYGNDHVAQIITFGTMAARAAIRDVGRALGYPYDICDKTSKMIPMFTSIKKALEEVPEFTSWYESSADVKKLIDAAMTVEGLCRHASMHACGVVITEHPVTEYTPLQRVSGSREGVVTQYAASTKANAVEKIGLLKMDFLGLKNLTIIQNTLRIVRKTRGVEVNIEDIPLDDEATYKLLQDAHTTGIFQLESAGMKRYLKQLKPTVFEDIIAMVALYRPGPMEYIPDFIAGKHGTKQVKYLHPILEPILKNTYGVAVYQEQLMQIARDLAGFTLGEADVLRKAVGKKILSLVQEQREKFVEGCVTTGVGKDIGEKVFVFIEPFAGYGFNRSHAACYALIGYQTAYLKAHYPAEFMAALLTSDQDNIDRVAIEVHEAREMGIEVLPPDVNESFEEFAVVPDNENPNGGNIRFGLNAIKNVGHVVAQEIVEERKRGGRYETLEALTERVQTKDLNKKSVEALTKVGALDFFGERNQLLQSLDVILKHSKNSKNLLENHTNSLFGDMPLPETKIHLVTAEPATKKMRLSWEKELLGLYVSDHPVAEYQEYLNKTALPINELDKVTPGSTVRIGGVISKVRKILTKTGSTMFFVGLEDMTGQIEILVFGKIAEQTESLWNEDELVIVTVKVNHKDGDIRIMAESGEKLRPENVTQFARHEITRTRAAEAAALRTPVAPSHITVTIDSQAPGSVIEDLSRILKKAPLGSQKVSVRISGQTIATSFSISSTEELLEELRSLSGVSGIVL
jgi:DNA polymerase III subunit alpha